MERDLPWARGERAAIGVVAGPEVAEPEFEYAVAEIRAALATLESGTEILRATRDRLAAENLVLDDLGMTPAAWYLEVRHL